MPKLSFSRLIKHPIKSIRNIASSGISQIKKLPYQQLEKGITNVAVEVKKEVRAVADTTKGIIDGGIRRVNNEIEFLNREAQSFVSSPTILIGGGLVVTYLIMRKRSLRA